MATYGETTLLELIRRISFDLGDRKDITATQPSDAGQIVDLNGVVEEANYLTDREVMCVTGPPANVGQVRAVSGSSGNTHTLSLASPFPQPVRQGDTFLMTRFRGTGWHIWEYRQAINNSIAEAAGYHLMPVTDTVPIEDRQWDNTGMLLLDEGWSHLSGVDVYTGGVPGPGQTYRGPAVPDSAPSRNGWRPVPRALRRGNDGYFAIGHSIELSGVWRTYAAQTGTAQVRGYRMPTPLEAGTDRTTVNSEWLLHSAAAKLFRAGIDRDRQREGLANYHQQRADSLRGMLRTAMASNTERLPA